MKKMITAAEIFAVTGLSLVVYGVGRLHLESAMILAGTCFLALGVFMAMGKPR